MDSKKKKKKKNQTPSKSLNQKSLKAKANLKIEQRLPSSEIGPVTIQSTSSPLIGDRSRAHRRSLALHRRSLVSDGHCLSLNLQASLLRCSLKVFLFDSLSLYLKSLNWNEMNEISFYWFILLKLTLFELWSAEAVALLIFCLFFAFWISLYLMILICWLMCVGVGEILIVIGSG